MSEPDWKGIALFLAECHAATALYDGRLKSCSKYRRDRLNRICKKAAECIESGKSPKEYFGKDAKHVVLRLRDAIDPEWMP